MGKHKKSYTDNIFKATTPTWNEKFDLLDGSQSLSDIEDCFDYVIKKHRKVTDILSLRWYVNKIEIRIKVDKE